MALRWVLTVRGLMMSCSAIWASVRPCASRRNTSTSRPVSPEGVVGGDFAGSWRDHHGSSNCQGLLPGHALSLGPRHRKGLLTQLDMCGSEGALIVATGD